MEFRQPLPSAGRTRGRWLVFTLLTPLLLLSSPQVAQADANVCQLSVPAAPLSASGLAHAFHLEAPCHEANPAQSVFVQGVVFNPATKAISTYSPLVSDAGTPPAIAPTAPALEAGAVVALFGGGNDDQTALVGPGASSCTNGAEGRVFGQVFFCGAAAFFAAVNAARVAIPPLGTDTTGQPCPSVRSFEIVDQDQSDNVQTRELALPDGRTAQDTAANRAALPGAQVLSNGSDNTLLARFVDPAIGCHAWLVHDLADGGRLEPTQATDELQAAAYQAGPVALIPAGDPMVGPNVLAMVNAYRVNVDQRTINVLAQANTTAYCGNMRTYAPPFFARHAAAFQASASPAAGENLYAFLVARYQASLSLLGCT